MPHPSCVAGRPMRNPSNMKVRSSPEPCMFTLSHYSWFITSAIAAGYRCIGCAGYLERPEPPVLVLRHDVDLSLVDAAEVAAMETELGVRSTFFVRVSANGYAIDTPFGRGLIRNILAGGHEIGLHFEGPSHHSRAASQLRVARLRLEDACGIPVIGGTIHLPRRVSVQPTMHELIESGLRYDPGESRFNQGATFFSDSRRDWGEPGCPCQHLGRAPHLYVLTHPFWWCNPDCDVDNVIQALLDESSAAR